LCPSDALKTRSLVDYGFMADTLISPANQRRTNSALWYGLLITLAGVATQFFYFLRLPPPVPRALPWINLLLSAISLIYVVIGLARAFNQSAVYGRCSACWATPARVHPPGQQWRTDFALAVVCGIRGQFTTQGCTAGLLSRLLVTLLRPRVTRHPGAASGIPGPRCSPSCHQC
jgi:hypothetical protein